LVETKQIIQKNPPLHTKENTKKTQVSVDIHKKYVVKTGDNLWLIAKKYHTTVQKILKLNPGKDKKLMPGDILILP
jgi:LysM repeat protein